VSNDLLFSLGVDEGDAVQKFSRALLSRTAIALKLCTMHALDNAAMNAPVANLIESVTQGVNESGTLVIQMVGDNFFLNGEVIKLDFSSYEAGQTLKSLLSRVGAQELAYLDVPSPVGLRELLGAYQKHARSSLPTAMLQEKFQVFRLRAISKVIEGQLQLMKAGKQPRMARVRRAIHGLYDAAESQAPLLTAFTRFDAFAGAVHFHLAAVTALTLLLCRKLQLDRATLAEACMAAALHDFALV
jgi:hypothetical protein